MPTLDSWRCSRCGRLLCRCYLPIGSVVEVSCTRCKTINVVSVASPEHLAEAARWQAPGIPIAPRIEA